MGGGPVYAMNNFVWGIDLVEEQFLGSCGIPSRPYMSKKPVKCIAEFSVNAQKTGKLLNVDWVDVSASSFTCTSSLFKNQFKVCSWMDDLQGSQVPILWRDFPGVHALNAHACGVQKFQGDPKIVYCRALQEKGANVVCVDDGLPTWVAEVGALEFPA